MRSVLVILRHTCSGRSGTAPRGGEGGGVGGEEKVYGGKVLSVTSVLVILPYNTVTAATVKCCWLGPWTRHCNGEEEEAEEE